MYCTNVWCKCHAYIYKNILRILQVGDFQRSYMAAQKSEEAFPGHIDTQQLIKQLKERFAMLWWHILGHVKSA